MAKILEIALDKGKTVDVPFEDVAQDGQLGSDSLNAILEQYPDAANAQIVFPKTMKAFDEYEGIAFPLDRAPKTLGTYVTRANKLIEGVDPSYRATRTSSGSSSSAKDNIGIEMMDSETVHLFEVDGESEAEVNASGEVTTNNFNKMSYYIEGVLDPHKWGNRLSKLRQFTAGVEATPPHYVLEFAGESVDLGDNEPAEEKVLKAKGDLAGKLIIAGADFDAMKLRDSKPTMVGGGDEWIDGWVEENFPVEA